jgi:hypothetical protein
VQRARASEIIGIVKVEYMQKLLSFLNIDLSVCPR